MTQIYFPRLPHEIWDFVTHVATRKIEYSLNIRVLNVIFVKAILSNSRILNRFFSTLVKIYGKIFRSFESRKGFKLLYHSSRSDEYLWYLILREKQKKMEEKIKRHPNTKFLHIFRMIRSIIILLHSRENSVN